MKNKIKVAQLKAMLKTHTDENVKITGIFDNKDSILFRIYVEMNDLLSIESEVEISIRKSGESVSFACEKI